MHSDPPDRDSLPESGSDNGLPAGHLHTLADTGHDRHAPSPLRPHLRLLYPGVTDLSLPAGWLHPDRR